MIHLLTRLTKKASELIKQRLASYPSIATFLTSLVLNTVPVSSTPKPQASKLAVTMSASLADNVKTQVVLSLQDVYVQQNTSKTSEHIKMQQITQRTKKCVV